MFGKITKVSIFLSLLFSFCFPLSAESIKVQSEIENELDSLLISGNFEMANDLLNKSDIALSFNTKESYLGILNEIKKIDTISIDSIYVKKLFEQYKSKRESFNEEYAGEKSSIAYSKFSELKNINTKKAIKYSLAADYLKAKYIQNQIQIAAEKVKKAEELYKNNKITEALHLLDSMESIYDKNIKFKAINYKRDILKEKVNKIRYQQETHKILWEQEKEFDHNFKLGIGGIVGSNYPLEHEILGFDPGFFINKYGLLILTNFSIYKRFSLGLDLAFTYNSYSGGSSDKSTYFFGFNAYSRSIQAYIEFLLKDEVGLRPHINLGLGYLHISSEAFTGFYHILEPYHYPAMNFNTLQILTEIGIEYIPSNTTKFILESKLSAHYNTRDTKALDQFNISVSLNIGIVL